MRMNRIGKSVLAAALVGTLAAGAALAAEEGKGGRGEHGPLRRLIGAQIGRMMTLKSEMDMSDEQREKIKVIVVSHRAEIAAVAKPLVDKRRALMDAVLAQPADQKAIRAAADDLGKAIGDGAVLAARIKAEVAPVFMAEQTGKMAEFRKQSEQAVDKFISEIGQAP